MNSWKQLYSRVKPMITIVLGLMVCIVWGVKGKTAGGENHIGGTQEEGCETAAMGGEEAPRIALTFDDGPSAYTERLSEGLKMRGVQATFFLLGTNIEKYPEAVKHLAEEGHLLGNHSYSHKQLNKLPETKACQEIAKTNNLIYECTGEYPMYVRPPFGEWDENLECGVEMIPVMWNVDSLDWKLQNTDAVVKRVLEQAEDGDVILMHDGYETSVEAAFQIVDALKKKGFTFVTADRMIAE
ncbi:MAG: polysaccharide deacetylase family protein [Clostridiales bacterium]|nr:polysaccharide deacetylase family protein [Clostridiales bacterium]